jgi:lipopolysaccharide exporter
VSDSLSSRVVKGGLWVFALRILNRSLGFVRTIILARLLAPADFGLLGIALLAISTLETFSHTGLQTARIHKKDTVESHLDTAWVVSAIRGTFLFAVLLLTAPLIAKFFSSPQAGLVVRVLAVSTLLTGCRNIGTVFFQKELEFNKQFYYEFSATLVDLSVSVTLAFVLRSVWALVWGGLAAHFTRFVMSYILHPYRPRFRFTRDSFKELFSFGRWTVGSDIFIFFLVQGDDIFVGKALGVAALGFYQMAYMLSNLPATEITHVISRVTFPAYSKLQDNVPKLREAYLRTLQVTSLLSFPAAGLIFLLGPHFTLVFLGEKWAPMIPAMQALCIFGVTRSINATFGSLFTGIGRPAVITKTAGIQLVIMILLIYPLTMKWGIFGTALAIIVPNFFAFFVYSKELVKEMNYKYTEYAKYFILPLLNITVMALLIISVKYLILSSQDLVNFISLVLLGVVSTFVVTILLDRIFDFGCQQNIKSIIDAL